MTGLEMSWLGHGLSRQGFGIRYFRYNSLGSNAAENARRLSRYITRWQPGKLHLVAHSFGGIVLMHLFDQFPEPPPGRVVLLGSPVGGSSVAANLAENRLLRRFLGRATEQGLLGGVPPWAGKRELGVIAGVSGIGIGRMLGGLQGESDGTVAVEETRLAGAKDFRTLNVGHMEMLFSPVVVREISVFLQSGHFT